uniref:Uncharacterized protein n=1 Tax=Arundo donax TaxID=35708 RepID=A0A0A9FF84_ARUDO
MPSMIKTRYHLRGYSQHYTSILLYS